MAKGIGLIGNFKGKVGNMVGYKLTDSNSGNTQGIRVYQPIVKNPKTAAQAEQRAKLAPINATYRALKMVIDRGNEGLPYGNKSRLAWLKQAFKAETMPWIEKGKAVAFPVGCQITRGSIPSMAYAISSGELVITATAATESSPVSTIGGLSTVLLDSYSFLKEGDQITFVFGNTGTDVLQSVVLSIVLEKTSTEAIDFIASSNSQLTGDFGIEVEFAAIIVSREGVNGEHLRSNEVLKITSDRTSSAPYDAASKTAAIESYMSSAAVNADWAEESIQ